MTRVTPLMWERIAPFVYAALGVVIWWWVCKPFPHDFTALMAATGTVAAVLTGFLSTAKAIVLGLTGSEVFQRLKAAGYHDDFLAYIRVAVYAALALLVLSLAGLFVEPVQNPTIPAWVLKLFPYIWIWVAGLAVFSFLRVTNNLFKLIRQA